MAMQLKAGTSGALTVGVRYGTSSRETATITIEGPAASVKAARPAYGSDASSIVTELSGYIVEHADYSPDGRGGATLTVSCQSTTAGTSGQTLGPTKSTLRIEMAEVQLDLQQHPSLADVRGIIAQWLASDPGVQYSGSTGYSYSEADGSPVEISSDSAAHKFCAAYAAGIRTFNRYYPVVSRIAIYATLDGATRSGQNITGGTPTFSQGIGTWDNPPVTLSGYPAGYWFKSHDAWEQQQDQNFVRTEQWTYTPEGSSGPHGWIYQAASSGTGSSSGGGAAA